MEALLRFWAERAPRERAILALGGGVLAVALLFWLAIEPAWSGYRVLERNLPQLRAQAAQLEALLTEVKTLKARPQVATLSAAEARTAVEKSLAARGLKATRIVPLTDGDLQMTFANVPYAAWTIWLSATERELGARAVSVTANSTGTPGNADIELALRLQRRQ
jgi:general secretion pathway protein M